MLIKNRIHSDYRKLIMLIEPIGATKRVNMKIADQSSDKGQINGEKRYLLRYHTLAREVMLMYLIRVTRIWPKVCYISSLSP